MYRNKGICAAIRSSDGALTAMLINKTGDQLRCPVSLSNFQPASQASVYRYSSEDLIAIAHLSDLSIEKDGFITDLSAYAITLVVIPASQQTGCPADTEPDGDADGADLAEFMNASFSSELEAFAPDFGRVDCLP
jgi:hypothetical protein